MSKKDYQAIARAINKAIEDFKADPHGEMLSSRMIGYIAEACADDNPRFDRQRFVEACETGTTKGMPKRA